jgi:diguanylate cyclase (GGDEF)-like protein/PAS domain S-box-containing protein
MYLKEFEAKNELLEINERQKTDFQLTYFITLLNTAKTDLLYLTEINKNLLNEFGQEPITKQIILNSNIDFINSKKFYSNLKLLNMKGKTILELKKGKTGTYISDSYITPLKGDEYYFVYSLFLEKGQIFITPFELFLESGGEYNLNEMRFSMPIFDELGTKSGVLVLTVDKDLFMRNYIKGLAGKNNYIYVLSLLNNSSLDINVSTVNYNYDNVTTDIFQSKFPSLIPYLKNVNMNEGQFYNSYGLFTFRTFFIPDRDEKSSLIKWFIVSYIPTDKLNKISYEEVLSRFLSRQIFFIILIFFSTIVIAFLIITRRNIAINLKLSEDNLSILIETLPALIAFLDSEGRWLITNKTNLYLFGLNDIKYFGKKKEELREYVKVDKKSFDEFFDIWEPINSEKVVEKEVVLVTSTKEERILDVKKIPLFEKNGNIRGIIIAGWDITDRKKYEEELHLYATTDAMTGVLNRRTGLEMLDQHIRISKRRPMKFTICYVDINNLKYVNDNFGHLDGDFMILKVVETIKANLREADIVCRLGGDEFMIIFIDCNETQARAIMERITKALDDYNKKKEKPYLITVSKGFAEYIPGEDINAEELIALADIEMYRDKQVMKKMLEESNEE